MNGNSATGFGSEQALLVACFEALARLRSDTNWLEQQRLAGSGAQVVEERLNECLRQLDRFSSWVRVIGQKYLQGSQEDLRQQLDIVHVQVGQMRNEIQRHERDRHEPDIDAHSFIESALRGIEAYLQTVVLPDPPMHTSDKGNGLSALDDPAADGLAGRAFDVFLCYNSADRPAVKEIGKRLKDRDLRVWFDQAELRPGVPWQKMLESQIGQINSAAVFVGESGIGPWQSLELDAYIRQFVRRGCPVIPVLLSNCSEPPALPVFLEGLTWVDFRTDDPNPVDQLVWGITGEHRKRPA